MIIVGIYKIHTKKINIKSQVHYHYENLIKPQKLETKNILIKKKIYKVLVIYFTRYHHPDKSIAMLYLYYYELIGKIEEYEGKKYLMVENYTQDKVLDKIKRIGIKKIEDVRILIITDDKLTFNSKSFVPTFVDSSCKQYII